ncbi:MAG: helix-turn-helix domain-containing protein [Oscillospiraceae bacterium]|jgi:transcriptional regulator with XRE-family HTH domain|nr:helix-turn-helix domain-containing protein [Oscillospiraceae bacterium]
MRTFEDALANRLEEPGFRAEYEALEPEFAIIQAMIDARKNTGLTQRELAQKTGMAQGDISKLESGNGNPSIKTLQRLAAAMDMQLRLEFLPISEQRGALRLAEREIRLQGLTEK